MDWLRCNRCYRAMLGASRSFSMTQCGHVYCKPCLEQLDEKCRECGNVGFQVMALTKPPKLESTINYFSPLDDFMELCCKAATFQENQMAIAVRGFQYTEKKYEALKVAISKTTSRMKELKADCQRLREEAKNMLRAREAQQRAARILQARAKLNPTNQQQHRGRCQEQQSRRKQESLTRQISSYTPSPSGSSVRHGMPDIFETPAPERYKKTPKMHTPENPYTPDSAYHAGGSTSDSGRSSMAFNSGGRVEGFLVPSIQRVPRSAGTVKRKTPTAVRISVSRNGT